MEVLSLFSIIWLIFIVLSFFFLSPCCLSLNHRVYRDWSRGSTKDFISSTIQFGSHWKGKIYRGHWPVGCMGKVHTEASNLYIILDIYSRSWCTHAGICENFIALSGFGIYFVGLNFLWMLFNRMSIRWGSCLHNLRILTFNTAFYYKLMNDLCKIHTIYTPYNNTVLITAALKYVTILYYFQKCPYDHCLKTGSNDLLVRARAFLKRAYVLLKGLIQGSNPGNRVHFDWVIRHGETT